MARYADIDVLLEHLTASDEGNFRTAITQWLEMHQVEDVAPVIHAHWKIIYESTAGVTDAKCSNCGYESLAYENDIHTDENCNYCPCCGAKMDEAEIVGKRMIDGLIDGMGNNVKSVGQQFCNGEE